MNKFDCYERCVQAPAELARFLTALHGGDPLVLAEDFCAGAALSREWVSLHPQGEAIATDLDPEVLERARALDASGRIGVMLRDALCVAPSDHPPADILFVGNFSIGEIHDRTTLVRYLRGARSRLAPGGVFICDTYGGESCYRTGEVRRGSPLPDGRRVLYTWEQRRADPLNARVVCACHFRIERAGLIEEEFTDAFIYDWRLWSVPELRDAAHEAGFGAFDVYAKVPTPEQCASWEQGVIPQPVRDPTELDESFTAIIAARDYLPK